MKTGDLAPDFELEDETGTRRHLGDFLARGPVVLFFYPAAMTRGCTKESCHFRDLGPQFQALGASRVGISPDGVAKQKQFSSQYGFDYPLLCDPDRRVAQLYGVKPGRFSITPVKRTTFVIDTNQRIIDVIASEINMNTHADRALAALQSRS